MKRTHLPLNGLRVLDAAARHLSFTRAADELAVTPAAVGQQIRALEDMLGVVLFRRTPKGLELTDEAASGLDALRSGFLQFEESVRAMQSGQSSYMLTIAVPGDFASKWLHQRLTDFSAENPELRYTLVSGDSDIDFTEANLDVAIRFTEGPGDLEGLQLGTEEFVCIQKPGYQGNAYIDWPDRERSDHNRVNADDADRTFMYVADAGLAIEAVAAGMGTASVPYTLAQQDIDVGRVEILSGPRESRRTYWLVAPLPQWRQKKVKAFVAALNKDLEK